MSAVRSVVEVLAAALMVLGGLMAFLGALGLVRLPDVASRLQAATKPQVLGLILVCVGAAPFMDSATQVATLGLVVVFQLATAPVLAQMVGRAAHRSRVGEASLARDELEEGGTAGER